MKRDEGLNRNQHVLAHLSSLPKKILSLHGRADLAEFVLRDLCHQQCFNLKKAAFFVDNPDFNCLKGVAGYCHEDNPTVCDALWDHPEKFMARIKESSFNQKVREVWLPSFQKIADPETQAVQEVAQMLDMQKSDFCHLQVKHGNHGLLIFEKEDAQDTTADDHLHHGLSLLGFCPVY